MALEIKINGLLEFSRSLESYILAQNNLLMVVIIILFYKYISSGTTDYFANVIFALFQLKHEKTVFL